MEIKPLTVIAHPNSLQGFWMEGHKSSPMSFLEGKQSLGRVEQ